MSGVVVVTGGRGEIGGAVGAALVRDGWTVVSGDLSAVPDDAVDAVGVEQRRLDVTDPDSIAAFVDAVVARHGRLDAVVCSAGIEPPQDLAELSVEAWDTTFDVNLRGPALLARAVLPVWSAQRAGSLVSIASRTWLGGPHPGYAASKAGLVGLTRSLALELAPLGVTVNAVAPSFVRTRFSRQRGAAATVDAYAEKVRRSTPLGRLVVPEDVAETVRFLVSAGSRAITGEVIHVCAGSQLPHFVRQD